MVETMKAKEQQQSLEPYSHISKACTSTLVHDVSNLLAEERLGICTIFMQDDSSA